jgi:hypothetical protein
MTSDSSPKSLCTHEQPAYTALLICTLAHTNAATQSFKRNTSCSWDVLVALPSAASATATGPLGPSRLVRHSTVCLQCSSAQASQQLTTTCSMPDCHSQGPAANVRSCTDQPVTPLVSPALAVEAASLAQMQTHRSAANAVWCLITGAAIAHSVCTTYQCTWLYARSLRFCSASRLFFRCFL